MPSLLREFRYAFRGLLKRPGFTAAAVFSLALGTGVNATVFTLLKAALEPVSRQHPRGWVNLNTRSALSYSDYLTLRRHSRTLADLVIADITGLSIQAGGRAQFVPAAEVSADYFRALGTQPLLGRFFGPEDTDAVVLTYDFWLRQFGADPHIVGRRLPCIRRPLTIVGVAPKHLRRFKVMKIDALVAYRTPSSPAQRVPVLARLKAGVSPQQAQAEILSILRPAGGASATQAGIDVRECPSEAPMLQAGAVIVQGIFGLILLIACANVANLLLARHEQRRSEISIRLAVGASRLDVARHVLAESVLLGLLAAPAGLLLAAWSISAVESIRIPSMIPVDLDFGLDWRVFLFTFGISILAGSVAGMLPLRGALRSGLALSMRAGSYTGGFRRFGVGSMLVAAQVAASLTWLTATGMFCRGFANLHATDPGFKVDRRLVAVMMPDVNGYTPERSSAFSRGLRARLEALPGVASVAVAQAAPLSIFGRAELELETTGTGSLPSQSTVRAATNGIEPGYFRTLDIPLVSGRDFSGADLTDGDSAIVNETLARRFWPGEQALGRRLRVPGPHAREYHVIGVARDSKYYELSEAPRPFVYTPARPTGLITVLIETRADPLAQQEHVRRTIAALDPDLPIISLGTMESAIALYSGFWPRLIAGFTLVAAVLALALASLGLYSTVGYFVQRRTREIGICMALGASRAEIFRTVLKHGSAAVAAGFALGLPLSLIASFALRRAVYRVPAADPRVFAPVCLFLALVAFAAMYIPARRATAVDPVRALRQD